MSSPSPRPGILAQARAVLGKELSVESRSRHGLATSGLFTMVIAATLGYSSVIEKPTPTMTAAMLTAGLLFSSALSVPRIYLAEDEQGTLDLLRLRVDPSAAYLGKLAYALMTSAVSGALLAAALTAFTGAKIPHLGLYWAALALTIAAAGAAMAFVSSLVLGASNKWILSAALGIPLLLPQSILSILALRHALGGPGARTALSSVFGLAGFAAALAGLGVVLAPHLWGLSGERKER